MMNKINFLKRIFGFLVVSMLFMGGFSIVIYLIAMIMGSNNAVKLTTFITSVYYFCSILQFCPAFKRS